MESNKDEAARCLQLAKKCLADRDKERATKYLEKSIRLFPTEEAKAFGAFLQDYKEKAEETTSGDMPDASSLRQRKRSSPASSGQSGKDETAKDYTSEQLDAVKKVLRCKDYYDILGVSKDASEADLKKAYRKLALQFHPDKNKAPGASEAFKAIGNAFSVLNDQGKRERYDRYGPEAARSGDHRYAHEFESDLTAEELFNAFFGGRFPHSHVRVHRRARGDTNTHYFYNEDHNAGAEGADLFRLLPLLFLVILYFLSAIFGSLQSPLYQLRPSADYSVLRRTETTQYRVPYYVTESFERDYAQDHKTLHGVERRVESEYVEEIQRACYAEQLSRQRAIDLARWHYDERALQAAESRRMPGCEAQDKLREQARGR